MCTVGEGRTGAGDHGAGGQLVMSYTPLIGI